MKMCVSGSSRNTVLDGGGGIPGRSGESTVRCEGSVPDKSVLIGGMPGKLRVSVRYAGGIPVKSVPASGVPDGSPLTKWAPAGVVRLLRTRTRRGPGCVCNRR